MEHTEHVETEIRELHQFFETWFNGDCEQTESNFARFRDVLDDEFQLISPCGDIDDRDALLESLWNAWGHPTDEGDTMSIWIEDCQIRHQTSDTVLATYQEWQQTNDDDPSTRLSTVLFHRDDQGPNQLRWLHVHETWLAGP